MITVDFKNHRQKEKSLKMNLELKNYSNQIIEQRIIETLLRDGIEAYEEISDIISEDDFDCSGYRAAFRILKNNFEVLNNRSYDRGLLVSDLKKENPEFDLFDINTVEAWANLKINTSNVHDFALSLRESSRNREICNMIRQAVEIANGKMSSETKKAEILKLVQELNNATEDEYLKDAQQVAKAYIERLKTGDIEEKFSTGFPLLDEAFNGGYRKGSLNIIGARPGMGKSVMGLQIVLNALKKNRDMKPIIFYSLEMSSDELMERAGANFSGATPKEFQENLVGVDTYALLFQGMKEHFVHAEDENVRLFLCDKSSLSLEDINGHLSRISAQYGGIGAVFVDYLQLMDIDIKKQTVATAIGENSKGLKRLAGQYKCPVIALCQLNREADRDVEPSLANLKDSGNIEQDAYTIVFICPDEDRRQRKIHVMKNRGGASGLKFKTLFWGKYSRFDTAGIEIHAANNINLTSKENKPC